MCRSWISAIAGMAVCRLIANHLGQSDIAEPTFTLGRRTDQTRFAGLCCHCGDSYWPYGHVLAYQQRVAYIELSWDHAAPAG